MGLRYAIRLWDWGDCAGVEVGVSTPSPMGTPAHLSGWGQIMIARLFLRQEGRTRVEALVEGGVSKLLSERGKAAVVTDTV